MKQVGVSFHWLRDKNNNPVACVASSVDDKKVSFAVASHNEMDKFSKVVGRDVATQRLGKPDYTWTATVGVSPKLAILECIAGADERFSCISTRAINAARFRAGQLQDDIRKAFEATNPFNEFYQPGTMKQIS